MTDLDFKNLITILLLVIFIGGIVLLFTLLVIKTKRMDRRKSGLIKTEFDELAESTRDFYGDVEQSAGSREGGRLKGRNDY